MLVENKTQRIICLTAAHEAGLLRSLDLRPGINRVDAAAWELVKDCRATYRRGELADVGIAPTLAGATDAQAVGVVQRTGDPTLLREWLEQTTSRAVRMAIEAQLTAIDPRTPAPEQKRVNLQ